MLNFAAQVFCRPAPVAERHDKKH